MSGAIAAVTIDDVRAARERTRALTLRTPLVECGAPSDGEGRVHLKLENLQPIGCFKARPIANAVLARPRDALARGIYTASSGNSALGVAWMAAKLGIPATALVPDNAPADKLDALRAWGTRIDTLPFASWWQVIRNAGHPDAAGLYIDAVRDPAAIAGDGVIGLEIIEQLGEADAIFAPFGGGGLISGIACAAKALKPDIRIIGCELESAAPLAAAFAAGRPVEIPFDAGFISGVGVGSVLPEMWPLLRSMVDSVVTVSLAEVAAAMKTAARANCVVIEGAAAIAVAAALRERGRYRHACAIVSGGNIDSALLAAALGGRVPGRENTP